MFKRILLTAVLGRGSDVHGADRRRGGPFRTGPRPQGPLGRSCAGLPRCAGLPGRAGLPRRAGLPGPRGDNYPSWHFRGFDKHPDLYWYPAGYGAGSSYNQGYWGGYGLNDVFGDDYYGSYGYRCNGYRDGYYYGSNGRPVESYGRPFYRRNADCESFHRRHGYWYGYSDCSRFEVEKGYCEDYDRHGHQRF